MPVTRRLAWMVFILLIASFLRWHDLPHAPPGMTHDEADHGLDAWGVMQGERPIYFTVGYGREPLYDYSTALLMSFLGPTYLAGRLTTVFFSLILIAGTYAWIKQALGSKVALLTAAGLALGFWPLMTARQALRSETLPALFVLSMALYWKGLNKKTSNKTAKQQSIPNPQSPIPNLQSPISNLQSPISNLLSSFLPSALLLGLTFYTYIPSRILWLIFPALAIYLLLLGRRVPWGQTLLVLGVAALVGLPLFVYLASNPQAETRVAQLAQPLQQAMRGEFDPLWANVRSGLGIFTIAGDTQWRYNIAGKPLLSPLAGLLFYAGLLWSGWRVLSCLWRSRRNAPPAHKAACRQAPAHFVALLWLALGIAPALATGSELSTTQAIGMQPVLYLFPALALAGIARPVHRALRRQSLPARLLLSVAALLLGALLLADTWRDYFQEWAPHPQVAVQYESELVAIIRALNQAEIAAGVPVAISSDAPGPFHDAAAARMYLHAEREGLRWFDGRYSLLLPAEAGALLIFSAGSPLHPDLAPYLEALQPKPVTALPASSAVQLTHTPARLLHFYPQFSTEINTLSTELSTEYVFGDALQFLAYELQTARPRPGETLQLATVWQVREQPQQELVLFTHILDESGAPLAQADRLDAPTHSWQAGDIVIQLHTLQLPADLQPGAYRLAVGFYHAADWRVRLPLTAGGQEAGDTLQLPPLVVQP